MTIAYLTRTDISSNAAQARQIQSMAYAFHEHLGNDFVLVSSGAMPQGYDGAFRNFPFSGWKRLRYFGICFFAAGMVLEKRDDTVFTRDIVVAAVVVALGGHAIYEAHKEPKSRFAHYLMKVLFSSNRFRLVVISGALGKYYRNNYIILDTHCMVVHDGVFPKPYDELRKKSKDELRSELGLSSNRKIVVHTGSLYKTGAELFAAILDGRDDVVFIHVGGSTEECDKWSSYYKDIGIYNIQFIPHKPVWQVQKYQVAADLLFYASTKRNPIYWCTSPLKLFEYMASGVPMIVARIGSVAEIVDESNAFCFDPDERISIKMAFDSFMSDPDGASRRAQMAQFVVRERYTWNARTRRIINFAARK